MANWLIHAGTNGEFEPIFLKDNRVYMTWGILDQDLGKLEEREALRTLIAQTYSDVKPWTVSRLTRQIWNFVRDIESGDLVILASKLRGGFYFGEIIGDYVFDRDGRKPFCHWRPVKWRSDAILRDRFPSHVLASLRSRQTISEIPRIRIEGSIHTLSADALILQIAKTIGRPREVGASSGGGGYLPRGLGDRPFFELRGDIAGLAVDPRRHYDIPESAPAISQAAVQPISVQAQLCTVFYGTNRRLIDPGSPSGGFSGLRETDSRTTHYGTCDVVVPKSHKFGSVGSPWWERLLELTDDRLKLWRIRPALEPAFWRLIEAELARWDDGHRQALVYLHGFNVSFEEAAIRAAQIGVDLKITGVMAFFSWPSKAIISDYPADEASIEASEEAITEFLVKFAKSVGTDKVHVIAHSMGNRGLLRAMQRIQANAQQSAGVRFGQIFLAAPDVDADVFCQLAKAYPQFGQRTTLYVSPSDKAVGLSAWLHGAPRAGFTPPVTVVPGIDTVEVPDFDLDALGHGYYAKAAGVLHDMFDLLRHDDSPANRQRLEQALLPDKRLYWTMRR